MIGNILIVIVLIFYGCLFFLLLKPMPGGDYGVGYSFMWLIYVAGFSIATGLLTWNMNLNHCFDWITGSFLRYRNWLLFLGWISFVVATIWSLQTLSARVGNEFPPFMNWLSSSKVYIWLPLLIIIPCLYLLNAQRSTGIAPYWIRIPMQIGFIVSILIGLGILYGFSKASLQRRTTPDQSTNETNDTESWSFNNSMEQINNYNETSILGLLPYTHREKDERLRNAAAAKIKSYEGWETELIYILEQHNINDMYWVYAFLDGNEIEHPNDFIQPVNNSLPVLNSGLQESLNDPNNLNLGYINIEAVCRVLDTHFKDSAVLFRPNILSLQKTLEIIPPARTDKQNQQWFDESLHNYRLAVENWLNSNQ